MASYSTEYMGQIRYPEGDWIDVSFGDTRTEASKGAADAFRTARDGDGNLPDGVRVIPRDHAVRAPALPDD